MYLVTLIFDDGETISEVVDSVEEYMALGVAFMDEPGFNSARLIAIEPKV